MEIIDFLHVYISPKKQSWILCFLERGSWIRYIISSFDKDSTLGLKYMWGREKHIIFWSEVGLRFPGHMLCSYYY